VRYRSLHQPTGDTDADVASTALLGLGWSSEDREDNWLISYADLLSVIFAMVVLLFGRMAAVSAPLTVPEPELAVDARAVPETSRTAAVPRAAAAAATTAAPEARGEDLLAALVEQRFSGRIEARRRDRGVTLTIPSVALFASARAELQASALALLGELAATLREVGDTRISVEGHTDDVPVQGGVFDSNWDLAAARANSVTRYLLGQGFEPARLQSVSYADTRPVAANGTAEGRAQNRRVELQVELAGSRVDSVD
jgi:chemotaxis protein MotB